MKKRKVKLQLEVSKYIAVGTLSTEIHGKIYIKHYQLQRNNEPINQITAECLLYTLKKLTESVELELNLAPGYVTVSINALKKWKENGYKSKTGKDIKYKELWQQISDQLSKHGYYLFFAEKE